MMNLHQANEMDRCNPACPQSTVMRCFACIFHLQQSRTPPSGKVSKRELMDKMIKKSIQAYMVSLKTINRLSIQYLVELFNFLIGHSWELRAKISEGQGSWNDTPQSHCSVMARGEIT